jgi:hypothetical protein
MIKFKIKYISLFYKNTNMPARRRTIKKRSRRGGSLKTWAKKSHAFMRKNNGYSRGLNQIYSKYGKSAVAKRLSASNAGLVDKGVGMALARLKQAGYGKCGSGLRRSGNGLRLAGSGNRMKY